MAKRMAERDSVRNEYTARKAKNEKVNLKELADEFGISYQTIRNWKATDNWDALIPPKKRGGQPNNKNSKGKKNAAGSHEGAPIGNKNAEKDGAYSAVFFDMLSESEKELVAQTPIGSKEALEHEMRILKFREHKVLSKIAEYEQSDEDALFINGVTDMRVPAGKGEKKKDGAVQTMGMYHKDSAFARILKLQEALYKIQGRIARTADSLRALEECERRMSIEREKLELLKIRAVGVIEIDESEKDEEEQAFE